MSGGSCNGDQLTKISVSVLAKILVFREGNLEGALVNTISVSILAKIAVFREGGVLQWAISILILVLVIYLVSLAN